jgi:hypothetical protein
MDFMVMAGSGEERPMEFLPGMAQQTEGYPTTYYPGTTDSGSAAAIDVRAGEEQRINFSLAPSRAFRVSGLVLDSSGRPLKQGFATVVSRTGGFGPPSGFGQVQDGKLEIRGVTPGAYMLIVGTRDDETEAARRDIDVGDQDINDLHINLSRGSEIRGSIRFVDFSGKPPDSMNIMLLPKRSGGFFGMASGTAKADGSFTLTDVFPEDYVTSVTNLPSGTYLKSVRVGGDETVTSGFNGAKATTMEIVISGRAATIEGNVTDSDGKPAAGATVVLLSDKPVKASRRGGGPQTANTDQNGHFIFRGLRPANYSVSAWEDIDDEDYLDPDFEQRQGSRMTSIKISEGDAHVENLKLINSEQRLAER